LIKIPQTEKMDFYTNMATIGKTHFEDLIENLGDYFCVGWSRNVDAKAEEWDTLSFEWNGTSQLGHNFTLAHPLTKSMDRIDYSVIEVRFSALYPFQHTVTFTVSDAEQVKRLKEVVAEPYRLFNEVGSDIEAL